MVRCQRLYERLDIQHPNDMVIQGRRGGRRKAPDGCLRAKDETQERQNLDEIKK